jgi:tetratricopeptide (TPR) repeat protein
VLVLGHRGTTYLLQGKYEEALEDFNEVLNREPYNVSVLGNRGAMYLAQGKYEDALKDFNEVLKQDKENVSALANRTLTYSKQKEYYDALNSSKEVIKLNSDDMSIRKKFGMLYLKQGKEALKDLNKCFLEWCRDVRCGKQQVNTTMEPVFKPDPSDRYGWKG